MPLWLFLVGREVAIPSIPSLALCLPRETRRGAESPCCPYAAPCSASPLTPLERDLSPRLWFPSQYVLQEAETFPQPGLCLSRATEGGFFVASGGL